MNSKLSSATNSLTAHIQSLSKPTGAADPAITREIRLTRILIFLTLIASVFATADVGWIYLQHLRAGNAGAVLEQSVFMIIVTFLVYGNLVYQFTRLGYLRRKARHCPAGINELRSVFSHGGRGLTVLVPSYKEEPDVIEQTLWSAALQVCPERRVVLLIDNPPAPSDLKDQRLLEITRRLPGKLERILAGQAGQFREAYDRYRQQEMVDFRKETQNIARLYKAASGWFADQAKQFSDASHTDRLFIEKVFREPAAMYREHARSLLSRGNRNKGVILNREQI